MKIKFFLKKTNLHQAVINWQFQDSVSTFSYSTLFSENRQKVRVFRARDYMREKLGEWKRSSAPKERIGVE